MFLVRFRALKKLFNNINRKRKNISVFKVRQAICMIRISAHPLMIEMDRYKKKTWKPIM
jgi:hypothetical protein